MTEASAYVLEDIQGTFDAAYKRLVNYSRKSSRAISAKKDLAEYDRLLSEVFETFEKTALEYPDDEETNKLSIRFSSFFSERHNADIKQQKERISHLLTDLKSLVHWRKMETAYGKTLGFSNFRSLRGESRKR
jgi:hypothetical protein